MAYSITQTLGDGVNKLFNVQFPFISRDHVSVSVGGVAATFTWVSDAQVELTVAPAVDAVVDIRRSSARDARIVNYQDASILNEALLDQDADQSFFIAQEALDEASLSAKITADGTIDALGKRVKNVADPVALTDATNKGYVDSFMDSSVAAASGSAAAASVSATQALDAKNLAVTAQGAAELAAAEAQASADSVPVMDWVGAWSSVTAYPIDKVVSYQGSSYICILGNTNQVPTNATYWELVAQKGTDGAGAGTVTSVTAGNATLTAGGTATDPTLQLNLASKNTWAAQQTPKSGALTDAATITWDADVHGQTVTVTLGGARTFAFPTNIVPHTMYILTVNCNGYLPSWSTAYRWPGGVIPSDLTGDCVLTFLATGSGTGLRCIGIQSDVKEA